MATTNLGVGRSNRSERANKFKDLAGNSFPSLPRKLDWEAYGKQGHHIIRALLLLRGPHH